MRTIIKRVIFITSIFYILITLCGCHGYSEINDFEFIAGLAIDKVENSDEYLVTFEMLESSKDEKSMEPNIIKVKSRTIHEAFRKTVEKTGKMIQGSHIKTLIISKQIAQEGIVPIIDLINRDVEVRADMYIFISNNNTAGEILENNKSNKIISFKLAKTQKSQKFSGKYISKRLYELVQELSEEGISPVVSPVKLTSEGDVEIEGTAIFKDDKLIGFLNGEDSLYLSVIKNEDMKSVFYMPQKDMNVVLEITKLKSKIIPTINNDKIEIEVKTDINTVISEFGASNLKIDTKKVDDIKNNAEVVIQNKIENIVKKVQKQYKSDVFGFGEKIKEHYPNMWKKIYHRYDEIYPSINVKSNVNINIKGTALFNKPIKIR